MLHKWLAATDGTSSTVRVALLDYRRAFDLVDHNLLIAKLLSYGIKSSVLNWIVDFLRNRFQRVKLSSNCYSNFLEVPAGIPQGTKISPWLFLAMINDLNISDSPFFKIWKFADDTNISEIIPRSDNSTLQETILQVSEWSKENKFQLSPTKCKEPQVNFTKTPCKEKPILVKDKCFEIVNSPKVLGVTITDDLKWNNHVDSIVSKASKRLYLVKQLKRADVNTRSLVQFYCSCIRSILEYACQISHSILSRYLSDDIEQIQRQALRIIFPDLQYREATKHTRLESLFGRREKLCNKLFTTIEKNKDHTLHEHLPVLNCKTYNLRKIRKHQIPFKTTRFKISSIIAIWNINIFAINRN